MGNVHHHTISLTTMHRTWRSQIPLACENESTNSGNTDDEPFRVIDEDHHALDGVTDAAVPPFEDDFPNGNAFLDSGSEGKQGEGKDDENDERDDADRSVYDSLYKKLLVVQVHGSKVPLREQLHIFLLLHKAMWYKEWDLLINSCVGVGDKGVKAGQSRGRVWNRGQAALGQNSCATEVPESVLLTFQ